MDDYQINNQAVNQIFFKIQDFFHYVQSLIDSSQLDNTTVRLQRREVLDAQQTISVYVDITQSFRTWQITKSN
jgi:hypothetical protein